MFFSFIKIVDLILCFYRLITIHRFILNDDYLFVLD